MNSELQMIVIKCGEADDIKALLEDSSKENEKVLNEIRIKALDLCKKGEISLDQMQLFFPTEMMKSSCGIKDDEVENSKDERRQAIVKTVAAKTASNETDEKKLMKALKSVAATTVPPGLVLKRSDVDKALVGMFSHREVKKDTVFGPYIGFNVCDRKYAYDNGYCWDIYKNNKFHHCVDAQNSSESNWMRFVNPTVSAELQNLEAFQKGYQIYFRAMKDIAVGRELLVWYSLQYNEDCHQSIPNLVSKSGKSLGKIILAIKKSNKSCDICAKVFNTKSLLRVHKRIHSREKPYNCDVCDKAFITRSNLTIHQRIHTREKPYKCHLCDMAFSQTRSLTSHKRKHTKKKSFKCDICDKAFTKKSSLTTHKRIHIGKKLHKCDTCNEEFLKRSDLSSHQRMHTQENPYMCDLCSKSFIHISTLNIHKRIHIGEKP